AIVTGMTFGEAAIREFLAEKASPVLAPFCGSGSIPLEAQRPGRIWDPVGQFRRARATVRMRS
ncbi:MAG: hypothetical protein ACE5FI_15900, partial [Anaerolineales bacterium]